jgi:hypothetical protein
MPSASSLLGKAWDARTLCEYETVRSYLVGAQQIKEITHTHDFQQTRVATRKKQSWENF